VCTDVRGPQRPTLLASPDAQHLVAEVTGTLAEQRHGVLDLVERLHPAASVGGLPRRDALRWLRDVEDLDRGWYAGPIGWTDDRGDGDFAVAIGSAQVCGDAATLYAGCGVAGGADPAAAFAETRLQLRTMLSALGAAPPDRLADDDAEPAT
ncbi:MAG: chorismate-binding protein, partial [Stackebrandtia sp.]